MPHLQWYCRLQIEISKAQSRNKRLEGRARIVELGMKDRLDACARLDAELRRRTVHVERKTKELDLLNRVCDKMLAGRGPEDNTGFTLYWQMGISMCTSCLTV